MLDTGTVSLYTHGMPYISLTILFLETITRAMTILGQRISHGVLGDSLLCSTRSFPWTNGNLSMLSLALLSFLCCHLLLT